MRETDISKFTEQINVEQASESSVKRVLKAIGRFFFTLFAVGAIAGFVVLISLSVYIIGIATEPTGIDLFPTI